MSQQNFLKERATKNIHIVLTSPKEISLRGLLLKKVKIVSGQITTFVMYKLITINVFFVLSFN